MSLIFVAEQLVGIDGISATIDPVEGFSSGGWTPGMGGDLGPTDFVVAVSDPTVSIPARLVELGTDGSAHVSYEISYSSPLTGRFGLASESGSDQIVAESFGDLWRIDYGSDGSQCSGYHAAPIECYAIGRWVEEAALAQAAVPAPEPGYLFVAMLVASVLRFGTSRKSSPRNTFSFSSVGCRR